MGKKFRVIFTSFFVLILLAKGALAYLDPGTGGAIIGSLWQLGVAFFGAVVFFISKHFWKPIKKSFSKILK